MFFQFCVVASKLPRILAIDLNVKVNRYFHLLLKQFPTVKLALNPMNVAQVIKITYKTASTLTD